MNNRRKRKVVFHIPTIGVGRAAPRVPQLGASGRNMQFTRLVGIAGVIALLIGTASSTLRSTPTSITPRRRADTTRTHDPIARLQARLDAGELTLPHDSASGYLAGVLRALNIPVASQGLVFSRTSLQTDKIAPWAPRAIYFNDDVYIGFVQGSHFLEVAAVDPTSGAVFYTLSQEPRARPTFSRETTTCLMCHQSRAATGGVPGFMVLSTLADRYGYPITGVHEGTTSDWTPMAERFGGWYVTGTNGTTGHSGNVYSPMLGHEVSDKRAYKAQFKFQRESARTDLAGKFDTTPYLSAHSDLVALLVLVHQTGVHNLITAVHEAAKEALLERSLSVDSTLPMIATDSTVITNVHLRGAVERLARSMLFAGEAKLDAPITGTTSFAADFPKQGPHDAQGRSLREFDLTRRLFKYPLSFLIYSESFNAIPAFARRAVYRRMKVVLDGKDDDLDFQQLRESDRTAILAILRATKPDFPQ